MRFRGSFSGGAKIRKMLHTAGTAPNDPLLKKIGAYMVGSTTRTFRTEGARQGQSKWKELAPSTILGRRKGKGEGSPKILQDTGVLMGSITTELLDKNTVKWGPSPVGWYGIFHQIAREGGRLPRREFLGVHPDDKKWIKRELVAATRRLFHR